MGHQQYRESLLERLRVWRMENLEGTIGHARLALRKTITSTDIDLLFDNWLNANFDRIQVKELRTGSVTAVIATRKSLRRTPTPEERRNREAEVQRLATVFRSNLYADFAARIWDTALPNGTVLRDAKGADLKHAGGWYTTLAKKMKPTEKVMRKFTTKQLFDLSQRTAFTEAA